jgi:hypothetical protein
LGVLDVLESAATLPVVTGLERTPAIGPSAWTSDDTPCAHAA